MQMHKNAYFCIILHFQCPGEKLYIETRRHAKRAEEIFCCFDTRACRRLCPKVWFSQIGFALRWDCAGGSHEIAACMIWRFWCTCNKVGFNTCQQFLGDNVFCWSDYAGNGNRGGQNMHSGRVNYAYANYALLCIIMHFYAT